MEPFDYIWQFYLFIVFENHLLYNSIIRWPSLLCHKSNSDFGCWLKEGNIKGNWTAGRWQRQSTGSVRDFFTGFFKINSKSKNKDDNISIYVRYQSKSSHENNVLTYIFVTNWFHAQWNLLIKHKQVNRLGLLCTKVLLEK